MTLASATGSVTTWTYFLSSSITPHCVQIVLKIEEEEYSSEVGSYSGAALCAKETVDNRSCKAT